MFQKRAVHGDKRWHSPDRDLAYCWKSLVRSAMDRLDKSRWEDWLSTYLEHESVSDEEIGNAVKAYGQFLTLCLDPKVENFRQALTKAGWFEVHPAAQAVLMYKLGQSVTGAFYNCIREVQLVGDKPPADLQLIYEAGLHAQQEMRREGIAQKLHLFIDWLFNRRLLPFNDSKP